MLQVEGASIDKQDHAANACVQFGETVDLDEAVQAALKFAREDGNTSVFVTADHAHTSQIVEAGSTTPGLTTTRLTNEVSPMTINHGTAEAGGSQQLQIEVSSRPHIRWWPGVACQHVPVERHGVRESGRSARGPSGRWVMTTVAALLVVAGTAAPAAAHTTLDSSTPRDGATVRSLETVTLRFAGPVSSDDARVVLTTEDDEPVRLSAPEVTDDTVTARISGAQPDPGRYVVSYSVESVDGDAVTGDVVFTLAGSAEGQPSAASERPTSTPAPTPPSLTPTPSPTVTPVGAESATSESDDSAGTPVLGLGLAAAVVGGAAYLVISRRRGRP